jgi:ubiquitin-protein ligase
MQGPAESVYEVRLKRWFLEYGYQYLHTH